MLDLMSNSFLKFYENLYKSEIAYDDTYCIHYLDKLELPCLEQTDQDEQHRALKCLNKGKSPGLDGFPPELYLELWDMAGTLMLD